MSESPVASERPALQAIRDLAASFHCEESHSRQAARLSLKLFDELAPLHGLGGDDRFRLHCAAILHDIGIPTGAKAHHKTALKLIMETPAWPLAERERGIVASVARYHRKSLPTTEHEHFKDLGTADRERVRVLAALLRVGDALDRCHLDHVRDLSCDVIEERVVVRCDGNPCEEETRGALNKGDLFEDVFRKKMDIAWNRNADKRESQGE